MDISYNEQMKIDSLLGISPLDGRYSAVNDELRYITSEYGLIKYRVYIEVEWFKHLSNTKNIPEIPKLSIKNIRYLDDLINNFSIKDANRVKAIEHNNFRVFSIKRLCLIIYKIN